jgi:hypothetical protein
LKFIYYIVTDMKMVQLLKLKGNQQDKLPQDKQTPSGAEIRRQRRPTGIFPHVSALSFLRLVI